MNKKRVFLVLQILLSAILILFIVRRANLSISDINTKLVYPFWIVIAIIARATLLTFFASFRWKIFLRFVGINEKIVFLYKTFLISVFWGIILPSSTGFDVIRIYLIEKRHFDSKGKAGATVVAERIFGFFLLALLGLIGSFLVGDIKGINQLRVTIFLVSLGLLGIIVLSTNKRIYQLLIPLLDSIKFLKKVMSFITNLYSTLTTMPLKKILPRALPFMLMFQISTILLSFLIFKAFDITIPFYYHLALMPIIQIITILPISISGFGLRESAFVFFYGLLGIDPAICFSVSIIYYLISSGTTAIMGGLISLFGQMKKSDFLIKSKS